MKISNEQRRQIAEQVKRFGLNSSQIAALVRKEYDIEITRAGAYRRFRNYIKNKRQHGGDISGKLIDCDENNVIA